MRRAIALAAVGLGLACAPTASQAAEFTVDSSLDAVDATADGVCRSAAGGCTLRAAVMEASAAGGASTIAIPTGRFRLGIAPLLQAGSAADVDAANGDLDISGTVTIRGAGAAATTIDGAGLDRVFTVGIGASVRMSDLTITGGDSTGAGTSQEIDLGGAILNMAAVTLERVALVGNKADGGGGMFSIPATAPVIRDSLIAGNSAVSGGGLRLDSGGEIVNTTITRNKLLTVPPSEYTTKPVSVVTLLVDEISGWGGGIDHRGGADVTIVNSTITDNHALKGGGGLASGQNYAPVSEDIARGMMTLRNTIVAQNTSDAGTANCHVKAQIISSLGHNLDSDGSCFLSATGDVPKADPRLGPLGDNGGPTHTLALLTGSPAIDAAGKDGCPDHDARGTARPQGAGCDIGAYEATPAAAAAVRCTLTVRLPKRLRIRARRFDVLVGRRVASRRRRPAQRVRITVAGPSARVTLRVRLRSGRTVRSTRTRRARCRAV